MLVKQGEFKYMYLWSFLPAALPVEESNLKIPKQVATF